MNTNNYVKQINSRHTHKLNNFGLISNFYRDPEKIIFNYSSKILSSTEKRLLSFGLNFKLPCFSINFFNYFLQFERLPQIFNHHDILGNRDAFINNLKTIAHKYYNKFKPHHITSPLISKKDLTTLKTLKTDSTIVICPPDKGRGVTILDKTTYINKMSLILADTSKFRQIITNNILPHIIKIEDKINNFLRKLQKQNLLLNHYSQLFTSGSSPGIMYGKPKTHKPNIPLRPILSSINTPSYNLCKFLIPYLSPLTKNSYTLPDSFTFAKYIQSLHLSDCYMTSFDVNDLFTNIPIAETSDIILNSNIHNHLNLPLQLFKQLLSLSVNDTIFTFNSNYYQQIDGMPMGSPLGPTFANIFLCNHESLWLNHCPQSIRPLIYKRYIDDCFLIFNNKEQSDLFFQYINHQHPNIKFSREDEHNRSLPFLDIMVTRSSNGFTTSIYRKPTTSLLGLNFLSSTSYTFKHTTIIGYLHRAYNICSSWWCFHLELTYLKEFFTFNFFPTHLIDTTIHEFIYNIYRPQLPTPTVPKLLMHLKTPYLGSLTPSLNKELHLLFQRFFPQINPRLIGINSFSIGSLLSYKDVLPDLLRPSVVYKFTCAGCNSCYVGQTRLQLQLRVHKHRGTSFRTNLPSSAPEHSSIREHTQTYNHPFRFSDFTILKSAPSESDRKILESLYIKKLQPQLNVTLSSIPLLIS